MADKANKMYFQKKEFDSEQKNILNKITQSFNIQMREIRELKTKISDLRQSLELMEDTSGERVMRNSKLK